MSWPTHKIRISPEINHRLELAHLLNERQLLGLGAEVGVLHGDFAAAFLHEWPGQKYYLIDNYAPCHTYPDPAKRLVDREMAVANLAPHAQRIEWLGQHSAVGLASLPEAALDYIYIDANHEYYAVDRDIRTAWTKLKPGGLLAGHDFDRTFPSVLRAVKEFSAREEVEVNLTCEWHEWWSWYVFKPL